MMRRRGSSFVVLVWGSLTASCSAAIKGELPTTDFDLLTAHGADSDNSDFRVAGIGGIRGVDRISYGFYSGSGGISLQRPSVHSAYQPVAGGVFQPVHSVLLGVNLWPGWAARLGYEVVGGRYSLARSSFCSIAPFIGYSGGGTGGSTTDSHGNQSLRQDMTILQSGFSAVFAMSERLQFLTRYRVEKFDFSVSVAPPADNPKSPAPGTLVTTDLSGLHRTAAIGLRFGQVSFAQIELTRSEVAAGDIHSVNWSAALGGGAQFNLSYRPDANAAVSR